jgi:hypothetical protein
LQFLALVATTSLPLKDVNLVKKGNIALEVLRPSVNRVQRIKLYQREKE